MTSHLRLGHWLAVVAAAVVGGSLLGIIGLAVGADYGGNYCCDCEFNGQRGYEATGQLGLLIGAAIGIGLSGYPAWAFFRKRNARNAVKRRQ